MIGAFGSIRVVAPVIQDYNYKKEERCCNNNNHRVLMRLPRLPFASFTSSFCGSCRSSSLSRKRQALPTTTTTPSHSLYYYHGNKNHSAAGWFRRLVVVFVTTMVCCCSRGARALALTQASASAAAVSLVEEDNERTNNNNAPLSLLLLEEDIRSTIPQIIKASPTTLVTKRTGPRAIYSADSVASYLPHSSSSSSSSQQQHIHWIVLVHGWMGNPAEMNTLRTSLVEQAVVRLDQKQTTMREKDDEEDTTTAIVVHCAAANNRQTSDGIAAGGKRLAEEISHWITTSTAASMSTTPTMQPNVTLSLVGNSLGGLYARYALGHLPFFTSSSSNNKDIDNDTAPTCEEDDNESTTAHHLVVTPLVFGTTATPHLGVGHAHTYLPLPRWAERGIAAALLQTGADLFRTSHVMDDLTFAAEFVLPLAQFSRRIAYANVHGTDFQVPTATAAFVTRDDTTPATHQAVVPQAAYHAALTQIPLVVQTTTTTAASMDDKENIPINTTTTPATPAQLATALDRLGWTKVFCDVRQDIPRVPLPMALLSSNNNNNDDDNNNNNNIATNFSSADLYQLYGRWTTDAWHVPVGHTVMVANAKNAFYAKLNAAGKPVMDALALDLLDTILLLNDKPQAAEQ